ncbi:MAG: heavy metal translocating P-type ATPase [Bdellovibrio sp. 28-41-41]|nr:MAG: heavy metal translocating P-type ATPase [Bdellovibrio sp. 28-41-41]
MNETQDSTIVVNKLNKSVTSTFNVAGMDCADEIAAIQNSLNTPKIGRVTANLMSSQVQVEHDPDITRDDVKALINKSGVTVRDEKVTASFYSNNKSRVWLVVTSGVLLSVGLLLQWLASPPEELLFGLFLASTLLGGSLIAPKAYRAVKQFSLDMNVLMVIAAVGAFFIREYSEGAAVVFLFSLAELLEAFSVARARKAIQDVLSITPQNALVETPKGRFAKPVEEVQIGETIIILGGDRVPLDGIVEKGTSSVNQAPLTGESQPVFKQIGDTVLAGTINETGTLTVKVKSLFKDSKISNVIRMVEDAQSQKAPAQLFVDKFAKIYTPVVTVIAILLAIVPPLLFSGDSNTWLYRSLVFLVIACPCALVIATPVSVVSALTALAKMGVLVKGGVYLESLGKLRALAVDKTGTITEGVPKVVSTKLIKADSEVELLTIALSLEKESTHPLARAVVKYSEDKKIQAKPVHGFKVIQGKGIEGTIDSFSFFAGNHKLAHELGVCTPEIETYLKSLESEAQSVLVIGRKNDGQSYGKILGILGMADEPRANVNQAIKDLHKEGILEISMLSGDNQLTASAIAKRVGIDSAKGDMLPENKVEEIKKLIERHEFVGMVGDGINDAPALAQATIGIAMGAAGTDAAIETADVALMTDDLNQLAKAVNKGRKALNIIRFNITFALVTKAIFIVLGALGYSSLWLAVAADMGATLLVIANSLRLLNVEK